MDQVPETPPPGDSIAAGLAGLTPHMDPAERGALAGQLGLGAAGSADREMAVRDWARLVDASLACDAAFPLLAALTGPESGPGFDGAHSARLRPPAALMAVLGGSRFLAEVMIRRPELAPWLVAPETLGRERDDGEFRRLVDDVERGARDEAGLTTIIARRPGDDHRLRDALGRLRRREALRIGARDVLGLATVEATTRELSDLAQALTAAAARHALAKAIARHGLPVPESGTGGETGSDRAADPEALGLCVLGMGKLGGRELNFSSDIDLVFVYDAEGVTTGAPRADGTLSPPVSNHVFYRHVSEELVRFLGEPGPEGALFRVDMRLRPDGVDGPLARSFESFAAYLAQQARDWERVAYLKARVMTGPAQLAERLYRIIGDFVFSDVDPGRIVGEIESLKQRIDREVTVSDTYRRDVKRGYGGIREIEFVIAAMQIIHGRGHRALHARNFFVAIERFRAVGLVTADDAAFLERAYDFLRRVEHRLQMDEERQTHTVPAGGPALLRLARLSGFADSEAFLAELTRVTDEVHRRFTAFFEIDTGRLGRDRRDLLTLLDPDDDDPEAAEVALARLGLDHPGSARLVRDLAFGTREVFVTADGQRHFEQMLPSLLRLTAAAPIPHRVPVHFHSFMHAIKSMTYYYEVIAGKPDVLAMLVRLFGTSDALSRVLVENPGFFDELVGTRILYGAPEGDRARRLAAPLAMKTAPGRLAALRRAVRFEELLCGLRWLLGLRPLPRVLGDLSAVADAALNTAMTMAAARVDVRRGVEPGMTMEAAHRGFAVVALGKYGGGELNFFGDLDVVFVADDAAWTGTGDAPWAELAEALTAALSDHGPGGAAYVLDARLRPHGRNSPLVTSLAATAEYIQAEAETWELMALTRRRLAWGPDSAMAAIDAAMSARLAAADPAALAADAATMRARLAATVPPAEVAVDFKRALGGLVDAEFAWQLEDLAAGGRGPAYFQRAAGAAEAGTAGDGGRYAFLRGLETATRLVTGESRSSLPSNAEQRLAIARLSGHADAASLESDLIGRKAGTAIKPG